METNNGQSISTNGGAGDGGILGGRVVNRGAVARARAAARAGVGLAGGGAGSGESGAGSGTGGGTLDIGAGGDAGTGSPNGSATIDRGPTAAITVLDGTGGAGEQHGAYTGTNGADATAITGTYPAPDNRGNASDTTTSSIPTNDAGAPTTTGSGRRRKAAFPVQPPELKEEEKGTGLPDPVAPGQVAGVIASPASPVADPGPKPSRPTTSAGAQKQTASKGKAATSADFAAVVSGSPGAGVVPDLDGLFYYLLLAGRDAMVISRGEHWKAAEDDKLKPIADNLAEALRRAFPQLAAQIHQKSPLAAALGGLGVIITPIIMYERMMVDYAKSAQSQQAQ